MGPIVTRRAMSERVGLSRVTGLHRDGPDRDVEGGRAEGDEISRVLKADHEVVIELPPGASLGHDDR